MRNRNPLWKVILVLVVLLVAGLFALPNLYGQDPAVQISSTEAASPVDSTVQQSILNAVDNAGIEIKSAAMDGSQYLVRFHSTETQLQAASAIRDALANQPFTVALNLAPATPAWVRALDLSPMFLGLDLRGGVHFLMEVDMNAAQQTALEAVVSGIRLDFRNERIFYKDLTIRGDNSISIGLRDASDFEAASDLLSENFGQYTIRPNTANDGFIVSMPETMRDEIKQTALEQNILILRNRVNDLGVAEPIIQRQGDNRIVVELPGVQDTARAKEILGTAATVEFRLVDQQNDPNAVADGARAPLESELFETSDGRPILLQRDVILTGKSISSASSGIDQQTGTPAVFINLNSAGTSKFANVTSQNIGKPLAVVFIENETKQIKGADGQTKTISTPIEEVINVATINDTLSNRFQISGMDSSDSAANLALLLRAGSLAAPIFIVEERTVGPSAGAENVKQGFTAAIASLIIISLFMLFYYRIFGVAAVLSLGMNLVLIIGALSALQATLTLPGIAGIILTIGMAVDANVLIFERVREELSVGNSPQASINAGFDKAFSTIIDANVTTLIAAIVLFSIGSGPVKGFAITLTFGILATIFSAVVFTRVIINAYYGKRSVNVLSI